MSNPEMRFNPEEENTPEKSVVPEAKTEVLNALMALAHELGYVPGEERQTFLDLIKDPTNIQSAYQAWNLAEESRVTAQFPPTGDVTDPERRAAYMRASIAAGIAQAQTLAENGYVAEAFDALYDRATEAGIAGLPDVQNKILSLQDRLDE